MKATRLNLCTPVRLALIAMGVSTVKTVNAVNAALGQLKSVKDEAKLGGSSIQAKKETFSVTETESHKYQGKITPPLYFDAWHTAIDKANKLAAFESVDIPKCFREWLANFKADAKELKAEQEQAETEASLATAGK
jgi:predicted small secreted protein